jgi:hypothetical protein
MKKLFFSVFFMVILLGLTIPANATIINNFIFTEMDIEAAEYSDYFGKTACFNKKRHCQLHTFASFNSVGVKNYTPTFSKEETKIEVTNESSSFPVSEPATMFLLGLGLAGLAGFWRKFKI